MRFPIAIETGTPEVAFGVVVPDLPGCFSAGDTVEEAIDNAREAIDAHCKALAAENGEAPVTKSLSAWQADPQFRGWTWEIVEVPIEKYFEGPAAK